MLLLAWCLCVNISQCNTNDTKRIQDLLDQILKGDETRFLSFCKALEDSGQKHIINYYFAKNSRSADGTDSVPCLQETCLSHLVRKHIGKNWNQIIEQLDSSELLMSHLERSGVFTLLQMKGLKVKCKRCL